MDSALDHLTPEEQEALRATFQSQAAELLDTLNEGLLQLEAGNAEPHLLQGLQRALHTLKGDAASFGLNSVVQVAHRMEDFLEALAEGRCGLDQEHLALLFQGADACEHLLRVGDEPCAPGAPNVEAFLAALALPGEGPGAGGASLGPGGEAAASGREASDGGEGLALTEYERQAARGAEARGLSLHLLRVRVDPRCRMVDAGAFLLQRQLQEAGEILRSDPSLEGPVPEGCAGFTVLMASAHDSEGLERCCLLPGIVAGARAEPYPWPMEGTAPPFPAAAAPPAPGPQGREGAQAGERRPADGRGRDAASLRGAGPWGGSMVLVDARRIDTVMNLVAELVIARSMFRQAFTDLQARFPKGEFLRGFREAHRIMDRSLADLQKGVMKIRMVPIDRVFRRLPRLVRDLAGTPGGAKEARLVLEGRATELDKAVVDALGEPLVHLIRNAVDHGIEPAAQRRAAGKPAGGTVRVAARAEGNQIVIEVEDDGRGIDPVALRRTAAARGLLRPETADALAGDQALDLIFLPGFSTATHVTDTSGRGIGMDAVRASLADLKGQIHVASRVGRGTTFTLRVPLTLAIIRAMLFRVAGRLFALPLSTVTEIARVDAEAVRTVDGQAVLRLRDRVISLIRLDEALRCSPMDGRSSRGDGAPGSSGATGAGPLMDDRQASIGDPAPTANGTRRLYVLVLALAGQRIGLVVDGLQGEGELVIKALGSEWMRQAPIAGGAILGDGRVVLILDPGALVQQTAERGRAACLPPHDAAQAPPAPPRGTTGDDGIQPPLCAPTAHGVRP